MGPCKGRETVLSRAPQKDEWELIMKGLGGSVYAKKKKSLLAKMIC